MGEIHDLLNTLGEEQNITAQKTALNDEPRGSDMDEAQHEADVASLFRPYTATGNALLRWSSTVSVFTS